MDTNLDLTMMLAIHDALRRNLVLVAQTADMRDDDPEPLLRATLGWELFKKFLVVHHRSEDDALWPALRASVAGRVDALALVDALEAEHAAIDPLLVAIDAAASDTEHGYQRLRDIVDELHAKLDAHLRHEESDGLPLIDVSLTAEEWKRFASVHTERIGADAPLYMPWLLNDATAETLRAVLGKFPPPLVNAFRDDWSPAYAALDVWLPRELNRS